MIASRSPRRPAPSSRLRHRLISLMLPPCLVWFSTEAMAQPAQPAAKPKAVTNTSASASKQAPKQDNGPVAGNFAERIEVKSFISDMADQHGLDRDWMLAAFQRIAPNAQVLSLMNPPKTSIQRSWKAYRPRFLQPVRIDGGVAFWQQHAEALARATDTYGVPSEIIVAIIGIETVYGRNTGNFQVLQALATLGFDYPSRAAYFKRELEEFLLYCHENRLDLLAPRGSYAGAIGTPQFMPGSIRSYATDFDGDARIDLRASTTDAIGSVARFLQIHGWTPGKPTHYPANLGKDADPAPLLAKGPKANLTIGELNAHGISSPAEVPADEPLLLVDLVNADAPPDYTIGTGNFYAITRYNRSFMYAMAVIDLADAIKQGRERSTRAKTANKAGSTR
ncbi:MAG: lytic murein transglycosylase B [Lautropia sp.]|nr:lytic murein transglycosylase B [Lautropia sp.]